jgi:hypothetical protein
MGIGQASIPAAIAQLAYPAGLAVDSYDNVYVADSRNNMVRRIGGGNIVTVLDGRSNPAFLLYSPTGVAVDSSGFIYVSDSTAYVRELYGGQLRSVAGTGDPGYTGDGGYAVAAASPAPTTWCSIPRARSTSPTAATSERSPTATSPP